MKVVLAHRGRMEYSTQRTADGRGKSCREEF
jgi:hypothetical protein